MAKLNTLEKLRQAEPAKRHKSWLDKLTPAQRREVEEIRKDYQAGTIRVSAREVHAVLAADMGVTVGRQEVARFLRGDLS